MKYLTLVIVALLGIAATTCIDGVWTASKFRHPIDIAIERTIEPGKAILSALEQGLKATLNAPGRQALHAPTLRASKNRIVAEESTPRTDDSVLCG